MDAILPPPEHSDESVPPEPLLFQRRQYLEALEADAKTTSCQKTRNPADYGPDD